MNMLNVALRISAAFLLWVSTVSARVVDNFDDNTKTAWSDFTFPVGDYAQIVEANGQFNFTLAPVGQPIFAASTKTSETFELKEGRTIEFRADLVLGNGDDSFAILAFIPTDESVQSLSGYGFAKSTSDILVTKALEKYFYNEDPAIAIKNENVTMVLSLTVRNGSVIINSKVLDKDANNAILFDRTFVDTPAADVLADGVDDIPPYLGTGNFVLMCYEDGGDTQDSYEVTFDNAEAFVTDSAILDDFDDNTKTAWEDFAFPVGDYAGIVEANGQFNFTLSPVGQPIFAAGTKTSRTFDLVDGERVEFRVDLVSGNGADSFAVLAFIPSGSPVQSLNGYGLSKSTTDILISKSLDKYFYNENPPAPIKNENVTLVLSLTARGQSVTINAKVVDKDANNAVLFERTFVDTPGVDVLSDGEDNGPAYLGSGRFVLLCYEDDGTTQDSYEVIFDNAEVSAAPLAANTPPVIGSTSIAESANFLPASTQLTFSVNDDAAVPDGGITVTLNGQRLTSTNGLTFSGPTDNRTVTLGNLTADTSYTITIEAVDAECAAASPKSFTFDTFSTNHLVIEVEDYNFDVGLFINNPDPVPEGGGPVPTGYANQFGVEGIDYDDTRTSLDDVPYRPDDYVRMQRTLDFPRAKYIAAGGSAAGVYDYDVGDIAAGEWLNYTRTFPAGTYQVYLREALRNGSQVEAVLEEVTSDPTMESQTTRVLGSFITPSSGFQFRNVPLADAVGNSVSVELSGQKTLRLRQVSSNPADGDIFQNYLLFVPVTSTGVQRATISSLSPAAGTTVETIAPRIEATLLNRETSVQTGSIKLFVNNITVSPAIATTTEGAALTYAFPALPASGSEITARLEFTDSENVTQTNEWRFTITYNSLDAANRVQGTADNPGFRLRLVQAPLEGGPLENSLLRAEEQLAANSPIPKFLETNTVVQVINFNQAEMDAGEIPGDVLVPGIDPFFNGDDDFAVEIQGYLDLSAGAHRFGVNSDDGYKLTFGTSISDLTAPPIAFRNGGTANHVFDFIVPEAGLYPFRLVWYERGGGAHLEFTSVNDETGEKTLINDPNVPTAIKSYISVLAPQIVVESSANVDGPYSADPSAVFAPGSGIYSVPITGDKRFFRIRGNSPLKIIEAAATQAGIVFRTEPAN
mgnify:FL=1